MKNRPLTLLFSITFLLMAFTLGFFLGRNQNHKIVTISPLPTQAMHNVIPPTIPETEPAGTQIQYPLDLNTADLNALTSLPGIGETLARRILDYREQNGAFSRPEELLNVEGIGPGKLEAILDYIVTGG